MLQAQLLARPGLLALLVRQDPLVLPDLLVQPVSLDLPDLLVQPVCKVQRARLEQQVVQALSARRGLRERRVLLAL